MVDDFDLHSRHDYTPRNTHAVMNCELKIAIILEFNQQFTILVFFGIKIGVLPSVPEPVPSSATPGT